MRFNNITLIGNLVSDPELKTVGEKQTSLAKGRLAVSDGYDKEKTHFFDLEVWGNRAENFEKYLSKGDPVFVEGSIKLETYEGKNGPGATMVVKVDEFQFLKSKNA